MQPPFSMCFSTHCLGACVSITSSLLLQYIALSNRGSQREGYMVYLVATEFEWTSGRTKGAHAWRLFFAKFVAYEYNSSLTTRRVTWSPRLLNAQWEVRSGTRGKESCLQSFWLHEFRLQLPTPHVRWGSTEVFCRFLALHYRSRQFWDSSNFEAKRAMISLTTSLFPSLSSVRRNSMWGMQLPWTNWGWR